MRVVFYDDDGVAIKTWLRSSFEGSVLPLVGDKVELHWGGDDDGESETYTVASRVFLEDEVRIVLT